MAHRTRGVLRRLRINRRPFDRPEAERGNGRTMSGPQMLPEQQALRIISLFLASHGFETPRLTCCPDLEGATIARRPVIAGSVSAPFQVDAGHGCLWS